MGWTSPWTVEAVVAVVAVAAAVKVNTTTTIGTIKNNNTRNNSSNDNANNNITLVIVMVVVVLAVDSLPSPPRHCVQRLHASFVAMDFFLHMAGTQKRGGANTRPGKADRVLKQRDQLAERINAEALRCTNPCKPHAPFLMQHPPVRLSPMRPASCAPATHAVLAPWFGVFALASPAKEVMQTAADMLAMDGAVSTPCPPVCDAFPLALPCTTSSSKRTHCLRPTSCPAFCGPQPLDLFGCAPG